MKMALQTRAAWLMALAGAAAIAACDGDLGGGSGGSGGAGAGTGTTTGSGGDGAGAAGGGSTTTGSGGGGAGGGAPTEDPCAGASDGAHCGSDLGGLADHGSLYTCAGGQTAAAVPCEAGCDGGSCNAVQSDPCASAQYGNGAYCGGSLTGGDPDVLYNCQNGSTASQTACPAGCQVQPPGVPDSCKPEGDPCANAGSGNGLYCGGPIGGDPNVLYNCQNGSAASQTTCPAGCTVMPPGTPDACTPTGGGTCCLERPPGVLTQSFSACGGGGSHYGIDYGTAIGTPIYAGMSGTVVGSALGFPNCYNNGCSPSCWNSFNYVKLKADCGDPADASRDYYIWYLHIDGLAPGIQNGAHVDQGQLVAYAGNSGCSSGPHIHIETASVAQGAGAPLNTCSSVDPATRYCP